MFDLLVKSILQKAGSVKRQPFIIAVSGFDGSGKSTLAARIENVLEDSEIVSIDSFVINRLSSRSEDWADFDRLRF